MVLLTLLGLSALLLTERKKVKNTHSDQHEKVDQTDVLLLCSNDDGQTSQHIISDPEVLPTAEEPITAQPKIDGDDDDDDDDEDDDDDIFQDCVCDSSECNTDFLHALDTGTIDFHVSSLNFNVPELPVSTVSDCRVDAIQASDSPNEDTVDDGLQEDYSESLPLEQQQRDRASDNETKPDYRVPEVPVPANDTPEVHSKVLSGLSSQWMTLAMISFIFITIYLGLKSLMMSVLSVQIKCFHQIIRIGYNVYHSYHMPWFRTLSWYFLLCVIYFFYGETVMDYFFTLVLREYIHILSKYHHFISSALYLAGFCMLVLSLVKKPYRQQFYMFTCTLVILLNVVIHSNLIIRSPFEWEMWFIVPISCVICNNIIAYVLGFFYGSTPLSNRLLNIFWPHL